MKLETALDLMSCPIPGSYAVDWRAVLRMKKGPDRTFSIYHSKRYDPQLLDDCMAQNGWHSIGRWTYSEQRHPQIVNLYRKQGPMLPPARPRRPTTPRTDRKSKTPESD